MKLFNWPVCAAVLGLATGMASAAPTVIEAAAFTFSNPDSSAADVLLSDGGGATTIGLTDFARAMNLRTNDADGNAYSSDLTFAVRSGYRITGYSFSGSYVGTREIASPPDGSASTGAASNRGAVSLYASTPDAPDWSGSHHRGQQQLNGTDAFVFASGPLAVSSTLAMSINGSMTLFATPAIWSTGSLDSWASLSLQNPTITIYSSMVPEPETYGMLAVGLAVIGLTRRTRKRLQDKVAAA